MFYQPYLRKHNVNLAALGVMAITLLIGSARSKQWKQTHLSHKYEDKCWTFVYTISVALHTWESRSSIFLIKEPDSIMLANLGQNGTLRPALSRKMTQKSRSQVRITRKGVLFEVLEALLVSHSKTQSTLISASRERRALVNSGSSEGGQIGMAWRWEWGPAGILLLIHYIVPYILSII